MASMLTPSAAQVSAAPAGGPAPRPGSGGHGWLAAWSLGRREWVRFIRQRNRVFGAIGQPVVFWLLFGAGLGPTFRLPGDPQGAISYREYFFPGTLALILLFTAIFTTISIIEDRREGFLQGVLVSPAPAWSVALGKIGGGTVIATVQALVFLVLGLTIGLELGVARLVATALLLLLIGWGLAGLGFVLAWRMNSTQGFHAVMSVLLLPMWLLSGAFFPAQQGWLRAIAAANPMSYGVAGLRRLLTPNLPAAVLEVLPGWGLIVSVLVVFAGLTFFGAVASVARTGRGDHA